MASDIMTLPSLRFDAEYHLCPTRTFDTSIKKLRTRIQQDQRRLAALLEDRKLIVEDAKLRGIETPPCP